MYDSSPRNFLKFVSVNFVPVVIETLAFPVIPTAMYNSLSCLINVPYSYVVFAVQSCTVAVDLILSNLIVVLKSLTKSLPNTAETFAVSVGFVPSAFPPVIITSGVVVYPQPCVKRFIFVSFPCEITAVAVA